MQKLLFSVLVLGSLNISAQIDPLSQYFQKSFVPTLVVYDSITVSLDSGAAFSKVAAGYQHYLYENGHIDTLTITENGVEVAAFKGEVDGAKTEIKGMNIASGGSDTIDKVVFYQDVLKRDSIIEYHIFASGSFQQFFEGRLFYNASGNIDHIDVYADLGLGMMKVGDYKLYYDQGRLDSLYYTIGLSGSGPGYMKFYYDQNIAVKLLKVESYEDYDLDGEKDLVQQLICKNNALNQVDEIIEIGRSSLTGNMELVGVYRFDVQKNSTISKPEFELPKVNFYPNPVSDFLNLGSEYHQMVNYEILSLDGKLVLKGRGFERIDVSALKSGHYILKIDQHGNMAASKFLKL